MSKPQPVTLKEVACKSILSKSGLSDWTINCYAGCEHGCRYCYARYMKRFTHHPEPWGTFVDARINAPEVLERQVKRAKRGRVILSSVCDGWQPLEEKYGLSRQCVRILLDHVWPVGILTKSALVSRDFDLLESGEVDIGVTVSIRDERVRRIVEPEASPTEERLEALAEAARRGIEVWAFLGPFLPGLNDDEDNIAWLMRWMAELPVTHFYVDRLNFRPGVASSVRRMLEADFPHLVKRYREIETDEEASDEFERALYARVRKIARQHGVESKAHGCA
jgi:DNA repair photolyase